MKFVVKLGGAALENPKLLLECAKSIAQLVKPTATRSPSSTAAASSSPGSSPRWARKSEFVAGLRITDAETRDAAIMVLGGRVNKSLVAALGQQGQSARWASPAATATSSARAKRITNPDLGFVGEIAATDPKWLDAIWAMGAIPVISSIALGFDGEYYNINADEMASACAVATKADALVFLTDVPGVKGADGNVMRWLTLAQGNPRA